MLNRAMEYLVVHMLRCVVGLCWDEHVVERLGRASRCGVRLQVIEAVLNRKLGNIKELVD
jgi:hypothetical protein